MTVLSDSRKATTMGTVDRSLVANFITELGFEPDKVVQVIMSPTRIAVTTYSLDVNGRPEIVKDEVTGALGTATELHIRTLTDPAEG